MALGKIFNTVDSNGLIFLRLGLGTIFIAHGAQKLFGAFGGSGFEGTVTDFQQGFGFSVALSVMIMVAEFFGGFAIIFGFLTRVAALGLVSVMAGAIYFVHWDHGFFLNWACAENTGHGFEFNLALLTMALTLVFSGPGRFSVDHWLSEL